MSVPRALQPDEFPLLGRLLDDVFRRSRGITDQSQLSDFPLVFRPSNAHNLRVIADGGRIVSHAGLWPRELVVGDERLSVGVVVSVATDPEARRRGYASILMREIQDILQSDGYDLGLLWTTVPDFYRQLGWQLIVPQGMLVTVTREPCAGLVADEIDIVPYDQRVHLDAIRELHARESVRMIRNRDDFAMLLALPKVHVWVALSASEPVAYLVHSEAVNKPGFIEYGGTLEGTATLIAHVMRAAPEDAAIPLLAYHTRPDVLAWAASLGLSCQPLTGSKTSGFEMIDPVRPSRISTAVREQLFCWGLDHV